MWAKLSHLILRNRFAILVVMFLITAFMGWQATKLELSYKYARVLPKDDSLYNAYEEFKQRYGEDGTVMVIGFQDSSLFDLKKLQGWYDLNESIRKVDGVKEVMSVVRCYNLFRNDSLRKFDVRQVVNRRPQTQQEADSIRDAIERLPFYDGVIYNPESHVTLMAITFEDSAVNSKDRLSIVANIREQALKFGEANLKFAEDDGNKGLHFSGMPYIRSEYMRKIGGEMQLFVFLSLFITAIILFIFFRYFNAVFFSLIVVIVGVVWSLGTIVLFGYKITVLSGLIPPLIVVIGIPNCIFLINKYQEELMKHGNKTKALSRMVQKVGLSNFLANVTTSIGFVVFYFTNSELLVEFGLVAAINVMTTYAIAIVLTPIIFSYLPEPKRSQMQHLGGKRINGLLDWVDRLVHNHRKALYAGVTVLTIISIIGFTRIKVIGYVVDDLPAGDPVTEDLKFFEKHFGGILPFEIAIEVKPSATPSIGPAPGSEPPATDSASTDSLAGTDSATSDSTGLAAATTKPKITGPNLFQNEGDVLFRIDALQKYITDRSEFSRPLSIVEGLKFSYQAYKDGKPKAYRLPKTQADLSSLANYIGTVKGQQNRLDKFIDSSYTHTRISFQMADVGSDSVRKILAEIKPVVDSLFPKSEFRVDLTGHSLMFLRSFDYLLHHLFVSLLIAIGLILLIGMVLFRSVAIIVLSKLPCLIPLVMTAGVMGFLDIPFKSSTILIFSIAFGIASDGTIYILTEYRAQLRKLSAANAAKAVSLAIRETGLSMIYTNVILFFGFGIFVLSSFGGTAALGILLSITLLVSLATNLILLPCILLSLEKRAATKALTEEPLIDIYDEEEDIDSDKLTIQYEEPKD